jgi:hypothetical protein
MTEDMLQAHADVLTQLGTSEEGARIRAQMQSASLLSDMEAFKVKDSYFNNFLTHFESMEVIISQTLVFF